MDYKKIILTGLLLALITGCSGRAERSGAIDETSVLTSALLGDVSILNPILASDTASSAVIGPVFSGLVKIDEDLKIIPDLARSWKASADGRTYTFYLRDDVKWHDGKIFTANDVKFTFDSILDPKVNSVRRGDYIINGKPIKWTVVSGNIIEARLPEPFAPFLASAGMSILPAHILRGKDMNSTDFNQRPVGTGPFKFEEWKVSDHITLVRNTEYYNGRPLVSKLLYRIIPDENSQVVALEAGEIDESSLPVRDYSRILASGRFNVYEYDSLMYIYLGMNLARPVFNDRRVRLALEYATDREQLIDLISRGHASPAYVPMHPLSWAFNGGLKRGPKDLKKAASLLDEAGWKMTPSGIREKDGRPLEFEVLVNQGNKEREKAAVILQWQYRKIGVKVNVRVLEWSALLKLVNSGKHPKDFDAVIIGWSLGIDPDSYSIWHSSQYPSGLNFVGYSNKRVDSLLESGRTETDIAKRAAIYKKMQEEIFNDVPYIFLWYPRSIVAVSKAVGGLSRPGPAGLFLDIEKVYKRGAGR